MCDEIRLVESSGNEWVGGVRLRWGPRHWCCVWELGIGIEMRELGVEGRFATPLCYWEGGGIGVCRVDWCDTALGKRDGGGA